MSEKTAKKAKAKVPEQDRPILVPVDFSDDSEAALLFAAELTKCVHRPLLILHVVHDPADMPGYYEDVLKKKQFRRIEDNAADMLEDFLGKLRKKHPDLKPLAKAKTLLVKGLPGNRITEVAKLKQAALIVLGSKGETGLRHLFTGSIAEYIVRTATIPVTVVKAKRK